MLQMLEMAERFHESASRVLDGSGPLREEPVYLNLSYALELGLKAFVRANGWSDDRCRREIRHDLVKAYEAALSVGLPALEGQTVRMLVILALFYASHTLGEFLRGRSLAFDPACSLLLTGKLLEQVRCSIGRSAPLTRV
ncbi:MAG TPA: hypothetical protein VEZ48_00020 [Sphingomonadaceae bacterium]|nr:hypothetical protein [Sphingomonadaceae bacterium]